jgi:Kae1-associated kinase Bud32
MANQKIIGRGAEAIIIKKDKNIVKHRIKKSYRLSVIDKKLRKRRTKREAKVMEKLGKKIPVPKIISSDNKEKIFMEFIQGKKLSEHLDNFNRKKAKKICEKIGKQIALLHNKDIIHGDLTTSNMLLKKDNQVYIIDFGLSFHSKRIEDKAVDLHLLKQALEAKHFSSWKEFFKSTIKEYKKQNKQADKIIKQLKKVESRGRYKKSSK